MVLISKNSLGVSEEEENCEISNPKREIGARELNASGDLMEAYYNSFYERIMWRKVKVPRGPTYLELLCQPIMEHERYVAVPEDKNYCENTMYRKIVTLPPLKIFEKPLHEKWGMNFNFLPLPFLLAKKKSHIINVHTTDKSYGHLPEDNKLSFLWSALSGLDYFKKFRQKEPRNIHTVNRYRKYIKTVNISNLMWPLQYEQVVTFESQNPQLSISILHYTSFDIDTKKSKLKHDNEFSIDTTETLRTHKSKLRQIHQMNLHEKLSPLYLSKNRKARFKIPLILLTKNGKFHFVFIKDLNKLLKIERTKDECVFCHFCLRGYPKELDLNNHAAECK